MFAHQHFLEPVVHRLLIHPLDDATLLLDFVDVVAGVRPGHGVAARVAARAISPAGFFWPAEPCVQLQQQLFVSAPSTVYDQKVALPLMSTYII